MVYRIQHDDEVFAPFTVTSTSHVPRVGESIQIGSASYSVTAVWHVVAQAPYENRAATTVRVR